MIKDEKVLLEELKKYDTPTITNVVATYPQDREHCLGLFDPWTTDWYTDQTLKCMYPELGRMAGHVVTVTFGLPDAQFDRLGFADLYREIEKADKPVIVAIKQDMPKKIKQKNGLCGGNMMTAFKSLGVIGVISDGPSRDLDEVRPMKMQYMLTGVCAGHGNFSIHAINEPVEICGMEVTKGDIVHMDENGAVRFPQEYLKEVVEKCEILQKYEEKKQMLLRENHDPVILAKILGDNYEEA